jgi:DNA-binding transcriptional MerR regulator
MREEQLEITGNGSDDSRQSAQGSGSARARRPRRRTFYSIGEVCEIIGVKPHVLRYWESRIPELSPTKNRAGNRVYQAKEIELIALIHRLVQDEGYTVDGARKRLLELRSSGSAGDESSEALRRIFLRTLGAELQELYDYLDPAALR